jgi:hypothetical protein
MMQLNLFPQMEEAGQFTLFPVSGEKKSGTDLFALSKQSPVRQQLLPTAFENECKVCEKKMERVPCSLWTQRKPYATFHCEECKLFLYIFVALPKPLLVWSDRLRGVINLSDFIEKLITERENKNKKRILRSGEIS